MNIVVSAVFLYLSLFIEYFVKMQRFSYMFQIDLIYYSCFSWICRFIVQVINLIDTIEFKNQDSA